MPVRIVSDRATLQSGVFTREYTVKNSGETTVYLGQDSSLTVGSRAFSLASGATLVWRGETELWAITAPTEIGELEVLYDASSAFTPGPDKVTATIDGPVTVNGNVGVTGNVGISGPVTVTGDVGVTGDINVTNSELNIDGVVFNKPSAQPVEIAVRAIPCTAASGLFQDTTPDYDFSEFASIIITVTGYNNVPAAIWSDYIYVNIRQKNPLTNLFTQKTAVFLLRANVNSIQALYQVPVTGGLVSVQTFVQKGAGVAGNVSVRISGSHEVITSERYQQESNGMFGDLAYGGSYSATLSSAGSIANYISTSNGPAVLNVGNYNTTTINANCLVYTINSVQSGLVRLTSAFIPNAFNDTTQRQLFLPPRPIYVETTCGAGSGITMCINK